MLDLTKPVQTRVGEKVRIYATDGVEPHVIHGARWNGRSWAAGRWTIGGVYAMGVYSEDPWDLINVPTPDPTQTYTISVRDIYGDTALEAPKGYRFKVENGVCAFRRVNHGESYLPKDAGFDVLFGSYAGPRLILEKESE